TALAAKARDELSSLLLASAANELGSSKILIVPDGILSYIPFAALTLGGEPLIRRHRISYLPSASILREFAAGPSNSSQPRKSLAVFADPVFNAQDPRVAKSSASAAGKKPVPDPTLRPPMRGETASQFARLPGTRREANTILALVRESEQKKALDFDASVAGLKSSDISQYRFIHLATHGVLDTSHPEFSGVVLSLIDRDGQPQDGFLRLNDIYNLKLSADLVVLSACQTALGKEVKGEGLVGLTRGFMYAGAPRVVATLWKVDDKATSELMTSFYRAMLGPKHLPPAAALRAAQMEMLKQ